MSSKLLPTYQPTSLLRRTDIVNYIVASLQKQKYYICTAQDSNKTVM